MPELPEVEHLRRTLVEPLVGRRVVGGSLHRRDVLRLATPAGDRRGARHHRRDLLIGTTIDRLDRHGKQLAMVGQSGQVLLVHLGMSGQLRHLPAGTEAAPRDHVHAHWRLDDGSRLLFRDPRRFGGLWALPSVDALNERWASLGPDALSIRAGRLGAALSGTRRPIKAALLDQRVVAGLGNIYVDEALFAAGIHPLVPASELANDRVGLLVREIRRILRQSLQSGGSTFRDYRDAQGRPGRTQDRHMVYGRAGRPCGRCSTTLVSLVIAQRTTVICPQCQEQPVHSRSHR